MTTSKTTKKEVEEDPEEEYVQRYYVIEEIHIENHSTGTVNVQIIQQGQPSIPNWPPK